jgi:polysaccharide chain length determinant protein (PEP-CTERM system associated)
MNQGFDISQILSSLYRRKDLIIAVALVVCILTTYVAISLPDLYRSSTLILVTPQSLPDKFVTSTVTSTIEQRMQAIAQQVLGRTMLETVVKEFNLFFSASESQTSMEGRVARLRNRMALSINRNNTFTISFDAESPEMASRVTARIASLFIDENLKVREQQATGTTTFINAEAQRLRKELEEQEDRVNKFRSRHWDELPENREANSRALEQLRRELDNHEIRVNSLRDRKVTLESQIAEREILDREFGKVGNPAVLGVPQIYDPRKELESLRSKYSERHPDVIRLRRDVENLSVEENRESKSTRSDQRVTGKSQLMVALLTQLRDLNLEMSSLQAQNSNLRAQISLRQSRVDNTSLRGIELSKLTRDYDITLKKYQDLLAKALESELSENMERKQKGEQFQIVDPANIPQHPIAPNRSRILIIGLLLGIGGGIGVAVLLEMLDKSFKSSDDLLDYINIPVLAVLPAVVTRGSVLEQRQTRAIIILSSLGILVIGIVLVKYASALLALS